MKITGTKARELGLYELKKLFSGGSLDAAILAWLGTYTATSANWWQSMLAGIGVLLVRGLQLWATDNTKQKL